MLEEILRVIKENLKDIEIGSVLDRLMEEFNASISPSLIGGAPIHRNESDACLKAVKDNKLIILHGTSGYGKSGVLYELGQIFNNEGIIWLPLRLDRRSPENNATQYGKDMGLPGSPVTCLTKFAGINRCVLVLDQLDAIRWTCRHSANALDVCKELIREILFFRNAGKNVSVILSCRTFDLEHDPEIKTWLDSKKTKDFIKIQVGKFPESDVRKIVGDVFDGMTDRQKNILSNPQNLSMWVELRKQTNLPLFRSATELMRVFWKYRRSQLESSGITTEEINKVIDCLVGFLEKNGKISAPNRVISRCSVIAVGGFKSFGIIQEQNNKITFCHQSYLDYLIAERLITNIDNGGSIITWLNTKEKQTLFRREQLRQALVMLAEESPIRFLSVVKQILLNEDIRFHLKHLVLELIGQMDEENSQIADFIISLLTDEYWASHLLETVFYGNVYFIRYLINNGFIKAWLNSSDINCINRGLWLLRSIAEKAPDEVVELLEPFIDEGNDWPNWILNTICWKITDDSDDMFELRLCLVRNKVISDFIDWKNLYKSFPLRALRMIEAFLSIMEPEKEEDYNNWNSKRSRFETLYTEDLVSLYSAAESHSDKTWELFLPHIERLTTFENSENDLRINKWQKDWLDKRSSGIEQAVVGILIKSWEKLAQENPDKLLTLTDWVKNSKSRVIQSILIEVYGFLPEKYSNFALKWLLDNPIRFELGDNYIEQKWFPARRLIERQSPYCSQELFSELEKKIFYYHDLDEKRLAEYYLKTWRNGYFGHYWGMAQYFLLPALAKDRICQKTFNLIGVLERKFGNCFNRPRHTGGWIGSTLDKNLHRISDSSWLSIIKNKKIPYGDGRWKQVNEEYAVESSILQFYRSLSRIAKRYPERFGRLALEFPEDVHPYYVSAIFDAIALNKPESEVPDEDKVNWAPASVDTVYAVAKKFINFENREAAQSYCRLIGERSSESWSDEALMKLLEFATSHPDPSIGELNVRTPNMSIEEESIDTLFQNTINCVRGVATEAIGKLLWDHPDLFVKLRLGIEQIVKDRHPVVRMAVIYALTPVLNIDRDQAVKWFVEASSGDDRIPASHFGIEFFKYTMPKYYEDVGIIIRNMVSSQNAEVSNQGSKLVTAFYIIHRVFEEEHKICLNGTASQRAGVAEVAADIISNKVYSQKCQELLSKLIYDTDKEVMNKVSGMFRHKDFDLAENIPLAIQFAHSKGFSEHSYSLISCIEDYKESLLPFSDVILEICNAISTEFVEETRLLQYRMGYILNEISPLLLRLYEQTQEKRNDIACKCLDAWDILFERRVGRTRELTKAIET